jgi:hypothetical protein
MNKNWFLLALIGVVALSGLACSANINVPAVHLGSVRGSGNVVRETRPVSDVSGVALGGVGHLYIEVGEDESLTIEAEDNIIPHLETPVRDGVLEFLVEENVSISPSEPINCYLTVRSLESISVSGLGSVEAPEVSADQFLVDISGSGDVQIAGLQADHLLVQLSGLGNLDIEGGSVESQRIEISGSGSYDGRHVKSQSADVEISGVGSATVAVSESLTAVVSGNGKVSYLGNPTVDSEVSGLGKVEKLNE